MERLVPLQIVLVIILWDGLLALSSLREKHLPLPAQLKAKWEKMLAQSWKQFLANKAYCKMNKEAEQEPRRGKTGRITGLACATPAPVSFFRLRQALCDQKKEMKLPDSNGKMNG